MHARTHTHTHREYSDSIIINSLFNPLNAELNTIFNLLALLGARHIFHVSRIRVKLPEIYVGKIGTFVLRVG
jgi:hypothetical protein